MRIFGKYGATRVIKEDRDKRGHVLFEDHDDAVWAMEQVQGQILGKEMGVQLDKSADKEVLRSILVREGERVIKELGPRSAIDRMRKLDVSSTSSPKKRAKRFKK